MHADLLCLPPWGIEPQRNTALITLQLKLFFYCWATVAPLKICGANASSKQAKRKNNKQQTSFTGKQTTITSSSSIRSRTRLSRLSHLISALPPPTSSRWAVQIIPPTSNILWTTDHLTNMHLFTQCCAKGNETHKSAIMHLQFNWFNLYKNGSQKNSCLLDAKKCIK